MPPRNVRYALALVALLGCSYLLFTNYAPGAVAIVYRANKDLRERLEYEERKYRGMLVQRKELVAHFGPTPDRLVMFPPDQDPHPPYTVWDFFPPSFSCPHEMDRLGALGDGGKWICGLSRLADKPKCVVYSFTVDSTHSFEIALLHATRHCEVWIYDSARGESAAQDIPYALRTRAHVGKVALGDSDRHGESPPAWTLRSLMAKNGHKHLDLLRVDAEGREWKALKTIVDDFTTERVVASAEDKGAAAGAGAKEREGALPFAQLQIELHLWNQRFEDFLAWWELLEAVGLRPVMNEMNLVYANYNRRKGMELAEYTFMNTRGESVLLQDIVQPNAGSPKLVQLGNVAKAERADQ